MSADPHYQQFVNDVANLPMGNFTALTQRIFNEGNPQQNLEFFLEGLRSEASQIHIAMRQLLTYRLFWNQMLQPVQAEFVRQLIELGVNIPNIKDSVIRALVMAVDSYKVQTSNNAFQAVTNIFASPNITYLTFGAETLEAIVQAKSLKRLEQLALLENCLEVMFRSEHFDLAVRAGRIIEKQAENAKKSEHHHLSRMGQLLIESANMWLNSAQIDQMLNAIEILLDESHLVLKESLPTLIPYLKAVYLSPHYDNKRHIIEILTSISSKFPSFYKKNTPCFYILLEIIFLEMIKISDTLSEEWLNPVPGSKYVDKEDPNQQPILYGMESLDAILDNVDCKALFQVFKEAIKSMNHHPDWRHKYAALMALSQISEYLKSKSDIKDILEIVFENVHHPHPRIRFACYQAIGQTVDDRREIVFRLYFDKLLSTIVEGFSDPVPFVSSHAFACFTNFAENSEYRKLKPYIPTIIAQAEKHLATTIPLLIQNALSCLHEVFNILDINMPTINYQPLMATIEAHLDSPSKQVRSQSMETLTKLLFELIRADPSLLSKYQEIIEKVSNLCLTTMQTNTDLIDAEYVMATLRKIICITKGALPNEAQIFHILQFCYNLLLTSSEDEEKVKICFELLIDLFEDTKALSADLIQKLQQFLSECSSFGDSKKWRAIGLYRCLAKKIVQSTPINAVSLKIVEDCLDKLMMALQNEPTADPEVEAESSDVESQLERHQKNSSSTIVEALKQFVVDCWSFMTPEMLKKLSEKVMEIAIKVLEGHDEIMEYYRDQTEDEEAKNSFELLLTQYESSLEEIIAIGENLYKKFKGVECVYSLLGFFMGQVCDRCLASPREEMIKLGLYIVDDALQYYSHTEIKDIWTRCLHVYLKHSLSPLHSIRQAGCFGLGIWIKKSPLEEIRAAYDGISNTLINCLNSAPDEDNQNQYFYAQDNVAAAIGHLVSADQANPQVATMLDYWLSYLPLKRDKVEARDQHMKLMQWFSPDKQLFSPSNAAGLRRLSKALKIFAEVYNVRRLADPALKKRIREHMIALQKHPLVAEHSDEIWGSLSEEDRSRLLEIEMSELQIS